MRLEVYFDRLLQTKQIIPIVHWQPYYTAQDLSVFSIIILWPTVRFVF